MKNWTETHKNEKIKIKMIKNTRARCILCPNAIWIHTKSGTYTLGIHIIYIRSQFRYEFKSIKKKLSSSNAQWLSNGCVLVQYLEYSCVEEKEAKSNNASNRMWLCVLEQWTEFGLQFDHRADGTRNCSRNG